jgi:hypothetical protein
MKKLAALVFAAGVIAGCDMLVGRGDAATTVLAWNDTDGTITVQGGASSVDCWELERGDFVKLISLVGGPELFAFRYYTMDGEQLGELSHPARDRTLYIVEADRSVQQKMFTYALSPDGTPTGAVVVSDRPQLTNRVPAEAVTVDCPAFT